MNAVTCSTVGKHKQRRRLKRRSPPRRPLLMPAQRAIPEPGSSVPAVPMPIALSTLLILLLVVGSTLIEQIGAFFLGLLVGLNIAFIYALSRLTKSR